MKTNKTELDLREKVTAYLAQWSPSQQLSFIEFFTHELTICIRLIWSRDDLLSGKKVEQIKWINEILHRLPMFAHAIRTGKQNWEKGDLGYTIENCISQVKGIQEMVEYSVLHSIEQITGLYSKR